VAIAGWVSRWARWVRQRARIVVPVVVVIVLGIATAAWAANRSSGTAGSAVTYRTVAVTTGTIQQTVSTTGTIEPATTSDLSFSASGQVTSVRVAVGSKVAAGGVLATIDSASLASQVASAKATVASDEARLTSDQSSASASAQIASDQATLAASEAALSDAESALSDAALVSPIAGTVSAVNLTVGQQVSGGSGNSGSGNSGSGNSGAGNSAAANNSSASNASSSTGGSGTGQIEVISTGSYVVDATVDSTEVGSIAVGDQAVITSTGATANVFGTVQSVGVVASTSSGVSSFPVVIDVTGSPTGLYAGSSATVAIVYRQLSNVLVVPTLAVSESSGQPSVTVQSGTTRIPRRITIGASSGGQTQVLSGLKSGELVVVAIRSFSGTTRTGGNGTTRGGFGGGGFGGGLGGGGFGGAGTGGG
jgi:membrane fusion protein, macrolide-specific efflux system